MGFLDKAKKLADQAQTKLDEVQKQFNETQGSSGGGSTMSAGAPPVEYDNHGRPIRKDPDPPHGDPLASAMPPAGDPLAAAAPPPTGDPLATPTTPALPPNEPLGEAPAPPAPADKTPAIPTDPEPPHGDPLLSGENASRHGADADRGERPGPAVPPPGSGPGKPGLTSGDPLAG